MCGLFFIFFSFGWLVVFFLVFVGWCFGVFPICFVVAVVLLLSLGTQAATRRVQRISISILVVDAVMQIAHLLWLIVPVYLYISRTHTHTHTHILSLSLSLSLSLMMHILEAIRQP